MTSTATTAHRAPTLRAGSPVLLVVPPFQALQTPSLGVSQLKANLLQRGFEAEVVYLNLLFAERIGPNLYEFLAATGPYLIGDFVFSRVLHGRREGDVTRFVDEVLRGSDVEDELPSRFPGETSESVLERLIEHAGEFVHRDAVRELLGRAPWMVGFSSTFQANGSSLAILAELKRQRPEVLTVVGGANCETEMGLELMARYPAIDFVGRGECDHTFVELVGALRNGEPGTGVRGFLGRGDPSPTCPSPPLDGPQLDANPYPDFDDYFAAVSQVGFRDQLEPGLAMETSRGCWWGQKSHCTFCAFNRDGMIFRSKTPERAFEEMRAHVERHRLPRMELTDNILDMGYFKTVLPQLARQPVAEMFWETKANLTPEQVEMLRAAGVKWIQPGIESLSDLSLKLMRKGSNQLQNVQLLKTCTEVGIRITWNWLFGFPGEDETELDDLHRVVRSIHHLQPPSASPVLYLERFAPYQMTPDEWGLGEVRPARAYHHIYPFPEDSLKRLAFFFESDVMMAKDGGPAHRRLRAIVDEWNRAHPRSHLLAVPRGRSLILLDTRPGKRRRWRRLTGLRRRVHDYCSRARGGRDVARQFESEATPDEVAALLRAFVDDELMLESSGRYLALATEPHRGYKQYPTHFPGGAILPAPVARKGLGRRALDVLTLRTSPAALARGVARVLRRLRGRLANRLVLFVAVQLCRPAGTFAEQAGPRRDRVAAEPPRSPAGLSS